MKRIVIVWLVCVLALALLFGWLGSSVVTNAGNDDALGSGATQITADFTLQNAAGKPVKGSDFRGRYLLVYFGFTHCPDICPTTLLLIGNALSQLGERAQKIQPLFITIDPERDTAKAAGDYAAHFGKNFIGLSGTPAQVKHAADSFKVYFSKVEDSSSALGYVVDHSGFIYLMGPDGHYVTHFVSTVSEQELTQELRRYVR